MVAEDKMMDSSGQIQGVFWKWRWQNWEMDCFWSGENRHETGWTRWMMVLFSEIGEESFC